MSADTPDAPADTRFAHASVAVVVKALNEERFIARCLDSAVAATRPLGGTVVLADSGSADRTIEIAGERHVRIVQLVRFDERSCGIGAQLGFQFVDSDYVYILDGDMELEPGFLETAVAELERDPGLGGVGGLVEERGGNNYEFERRKSLADGQVAGEVAALDMGGLYRTAAVRKAGYLTNRNLHSYEEKELSLRLAAHGYRLRRLAIPAVIHHGKQEGSAALLWKRVRSRHLDGAGEMTRRFLGTPLFRRCLTLFGTVIAVALSWMVLLASLLLLPATRVALAGVTVAVVFHILVLLNFGRRYRSSAQAVTGYANINLLAFCFVRGFVRRQRDPGEWIQARVLK